jgi:probable phosphoglycerate mutase
MPMSGATKPTGTGSATDSAPAITLVFDGGSLGNPGKGYGSFITRGLFTTREPVRLEYPGKTTNNEAEYLSLINGLKAILRKAEREARDPRGISVTILSDSKLVVEQVSGRWKVKHDGLKPLHAEAVQLLRRFGNWRLEWQPRAESVRLLGH